MTLQPDTTHEISVTVNGEQRTGSVSSGLLLTEYLRETLKLTGTHRGCESSRCGACTVLLDGEAVKSCTMLAVQADGCRIETIEGIGGDDRDLHPVQEAFWDNHGLQCGFCTPGMVCSSVALLEENPEPTVEEIQEALVGNLCRCTGYTNIIKSVQAAAAKGAGESDE